MLVKPDAPADATVEPVLPVAETVAEFTPSARAPEMPTPKLPAAAMACDSTRLPPSAPPALWRARKLTEPLFERALALVPSVLLKSGVALTSLQLSAALKAPSTDTPTTEPSTFSCVSAFTSMAPLVVTSALSPMPAETVGWTLMKLKFTDTPIAPPVTPTTTAPTSTDESAVTARLWTVPVCPIWAPLATRAPVLPPTSRSTQAAPMAKPPPAAVPTSRLKRWSLIADTVIAPE